MRTGAFFPLLCILLACDSPAFARGSSIGPGVARHVGRELKQDRACETASDRAGYACMLKAPGLGMAVHWVLGPVSGENLAPSAPTPSGGEISILLEGNTTGWLSLSFADTALSMSPADAVLGWVEADGAVVVKSYRIAAKSVSASNEDADVPLTNIAGSETDGVTVIEYTRALNAGAFPINASSPSIRVNAAHGADGEDSLVYHGTNRAAFTADLAAEQQEVEDATPVGPGPAPAAPEEDATMPCQLASNKNGYACMTTIPGVDAMTVHWVVGPVSGTGFNDSAPTPSKGDISILMEGNTTGWLGFAFGGSSLAMNPADAVLGWVEEGGTVVAKSYKITRKGILDSDEDPAIPLADVRGSQLDGVTTIEFTRAMNAGQFPINITAGPVRTNAAHGDEDSLSYHGANRNSFMTNFTIGSQVKADSVYYLDDDDDEESSCRSVMVHFMSASLALLAAAASLSLLEQ